MLTDTEMKKLEAGLAAITYKPGWRFKWRWNAGLSGVLEMSWLAPDARRGDMRSITRVTVLEFEVKDIQLVVTTTTVIDNFILQQMAANPDMLLQYVRMQITNSERHEQNEFLKIHGVHVTDPHP